MNKLNSKIEKYGFHYNFKSFIIQLLLFLVLVVIAAKLYLLKTIYMIILVLCALLVFPVIIISQYQYIYNNQRFENLVNYMEKSIIFFKQEPKIVSCITNMMNYTDKHTKEKLQQALDILNNDLSEKRYDTALKIIDDMYYSSRLVSMHRFMKTVEKQSSSSYRPSLNNLDYDIKEWVNRIYVYQSDLKVKKTQFMISLIASILLLAIFSIMWIEVNELTHMIEEPLYQISTCLFLIFSLMIFTFVQSRVNGQWLVEDYKHKDQNELKHIHYVEQFKYKTMLKGEIIKMIIFMIMFIAGIYIKHIGIMMVSFLGILYAFYEPVRIYKLKKKKIRSILIMEFPLWLRDVALNLNNYVVLKAIKQSLDYAHPVLQYYVRKLIDDIELHPNDVSIYTSFLKDYQIPDLSSIMLSLYSMQDTKHDYMQEEMSDLIKRNQIMLINAEKIRNHNALIGVLVLSFVPILLTMIKIFIDMFLMLIKIFEYMGGV